MASSAMPMPEAAAIDGRGVASFILGIFSLVFFWVPFIALALGIVGLVLGITGASSTRSWLSTAGAALSGAGILLGVLLIMLAVYAAL